MNRKIVLASASPRRFALLSELGLSFEALPADIDENCITADVPVLAGELALAKAKAVLKLRPHAVVIGSDTIVIKDGQILGKPKDAKDAARMLNLLSGSTHTVATGIAVVCGKKEVFDTVCTDVTFKPLDTAEIAKYIATGEPFDKAGGYGIQGRARALISGISGDYYTVVGLPVCRLCQILKENFGIEVL